MILVLENEVDLDNRYLVDEIVSYLPESRVYDFTEHHTAPSLDGVDGVIVGGSTAGVYQDDQYLWMEEQKDFIRGLVEQNVPTLGICFGHQIVNSALGGNVEHSGNRKANLVRADLYDDPLFTGVEPVVPVLHSDVVTETGRGLDVIATSGYYDNFATRHRSSPVWTVQFHPEFTPRVKHLGMGWEDNHLSFEECTATRTLENFHRIATEGVPAEHA